MKWILLALIVTLGGCALHRHDAAAADVEQWTLSGNVSDDDWFCVDRTIRESPVDLKVMCVRVKAVRHFIRGLRSAE